MDVLIKALKERGLPVTVIEVKLTPEKRKRVKQIERDVRKYVMEIERAHEKAAHSTLHFGTKLGAPNYLRCPLFLNDY